MALSNVNPTEEQVKKVLNSVGCEVDNEALKRVFESLKGKKLEEVIKSGMSKLATIGGSSKGAAPVQAAAAPAKKEA